MYMNTSHFYLQCIIRFIPVIVIDPIKFFINLYVTKFIGHTVYKVTLLLYKLGVHGHGVHGHGVHGHGVHGHGVHGHGVHGHGVHGHGVSAVSHCADITFF